MTEQQQAKQHAENIKVANDNEQALSGKITFNTIITGVASLLIMAILAGGWGELKGLHDASIATADELKAIHLELDDHKDQLHKIWDALKKNPYAETSRKSWMDE